MKKNESFFSARISLLLFLVLAASMFTISYASATGVGYSDPVQTHSNVRQKKPKKVVKHKMTQAQRTIVSPGDWGGIGIRLVVGSKTTEIEYDCGHGEITDVLKVDKDGNFDAKGSHTRQMPGPTRQDSPDIPEPARYIGRIIGNQMTLKITVTDKKIQIGDFQLELGKKVRLHKCL